MSFTQRRTVRFDEVDYARVVYYPRFYEYCHNTFEDFFAVEVGVPYATVLTERRVGFPTVHCDADFKHPLRFGDAFRIEMDVTKLSRSTIGARYRVLLGETQRLCAKLEVVTTSVDLDRFRPVTLPEDIRMAFLNHLVGLSV